MKIDLLYEVETDRPFDRLHQRELFEEVLRQVELADQLGYHTAWFVEHHFLVEFAHSSAPEVILGALSQRTERIRLGHGVVLLPYPFNHPIRVAERIATLDILSGGRVEFGTGRSSAYEQLGFEIAPEESRAMWQEALSIIPKMWRDEPFSYEGRFFRIPERHVIPKPIQQPHPPIWLACTSPESWRLAGLNGIGALGFSFVMEMEEFATNMRAYREHLAQARPVGEFINDQVGAFTMVFCAPSDQEAEEAALEAFGWYILSSYKLFLAHTKGAGWQVLREKERAFLAALEKRTREVFDYLREHNSIVVGSPDRCIDALKRYEALGVDRMLCLMQVRGIPLPEVRRSIELFGKEVVPVFHEAHRGVS
jgi:alkanesulfonate monooxygenase SsuD/methylene tetrahydromethanopterin reductase-like flavin-dependent oxidoreductase (luciferase family)